MQTASLQAKNEYRNNSNKNKPANEQEGKLRHYEPLTGVVHHHHLEGHVSEFEILAVSFSILTNVLIP
jgi:hypothetical protein